MATTSKGIREEFARFFEEPSRETLRDLLRQHTGETDQLDFKQDWPAFPKVARHLLAIANSGGGALVVGVAQKDDGLLTSVGLQNLVDKREIYQGVSKFISSQLTYQILDFAYTASEYDVIQGKKFQVIIVEDRPEYIPFVAKDNSEGIRRAAIYIRQGTGSEEVNYEELQNVLNRRLETRYSSTSELHLAQELQELKVLYSQVQPYRERSFAYLSAYEAALNERNPSYPQESFDDFIARLIEVKKQRIKNLIKF